MDGLNNKQFSFFSVLTYYGHMLIINAVEGDHVETEVLPTDRRHAG